MDEIIRQYGTAMLGAVAALLCIELFGGLFWRVDGLAGIIFSLFTEVYL